MENMTAQEKIDAAREEVASENWEYALRMGKVQWKEDPTCKTGWINGREIAWNPAWIDTLTLAETKAFIAHEFDHIKFKHHFRRAGRPQDEWNVAGDYAINAHNPYPLPKGGMRRADYDGLAAEDIYDLEEADRQPEPPEAKQPEPEPQEGDEGEGKPEPGEGEPEEDEGEGEGEGENGASEGEEGASGEPGGANPPSEGEEGKGDGQTSQNGTQGDGAGEAGEHGTDPGNMGEVRDAVDEEGNPADAAEIERQENELDIELAQAARIAKSVGQLTPGQERIIKELISPRYDGLELLEQYITRLAKQDYTWSRPNRRHIHSGLYLPSLRSEEMGEMILIVDTSGSIDMGLYRRMMERVRGVLERFKLTCRVIFCDDEIQGDVEEVDNDNIMDLVPRGFGGTDFRPPFEWIDEQGITPTVVVYFTDLDCNRFPEDPGYPVVWATWKYTNAPFGDVIKLNR